MPTLPFATSVRSLNRLRQIASVLAAHGFGHIVERLQLSRYLPLGKRVQPRVDAGHPDQVAVGRRLASVCAELGPTFVKLGQMISTRPDLVSKEIIHELRKLQDDVPPFDNDVARRIITEETGAPIEECFDHVDAEPFASGSIGQVYHARTLAGEDVVVKVKRPGIEHTVRYDLHLLHWLANAMEQWIPEARQFRPVKIVEEFEHLLIREMDYISEASATSRFEEAFAEEEHVVVPHVHWELTGARVLTLTRLEGRNIDTLLEAGGAGIDRPLLARRLVELYLKQFFDMRLFHADPHPGNFLITAPADIGIIDFGQVATLSDEMAGHLVVMIIAMIYREPRVFVDVLEDLGAVQAETDTRALTRSLRSILDKYYGLPIKRLDLGTVLNEISETIRSHKAVLPQELVLVLKTIVTVGGVAMHLDPEMDLVGVVSPRIKRLVAGRLSPHRLVRSAGVSLWHIISVFKNAPGQLHKAVRQIGRGQWQVNIRHENLDRLTAELDRSSNRLAMSVVIAAIIVGSSVVVRTDPSITILGIPLQIFGIAGYLFAGVMGAALLWAIFRSGRLY